jgi:hypothetical protein
MKLLEAATSSGLALAPSTSPDDDAASTLPALQPARNVDQCQCLRSGGDSVPTFRNCCEQTRDAANPVIKLCNGCVQFVGIVCSPA